MRCKSVCVPQALPLSIAVTGRASADVRFLQHHMVLRLTTRRPTLSTDLNHRNSLQWKKKYNCDRSSTFKMFTGTGILVCSSCDLVHWKWTPENVGRYKGDAESAWYYTFALTTGSQKTHLNACTWTPPSCGSNDNGWPMKNGYCAEGTYGSATAIQISAAYSCPDDGNSILPNGEIHLRQYKVSQTRTPNQPTLTVTNTKFTFSKGCTTILGMNSLTVKTTNKIHMYSRKTNRYRFPNTFKLHCGGIPTTVPQLRPPVAGFWT